MSSDEVPPPPPMEDDRVAMMLGLVPDKRTPGERLWDAVRTNGESLKYHYDGCQSDPHLGSIPPSTGSDDSGGDRDREQG